MRLPTPASVAARKPRRRATGPSKHLKNLQPSPPPRGYPSRHSLARRRHRRSTGRRDQPDAGSGRPLQAAANHRHRAKFQALGSFGGMPYNIRPSRLVSRALTHSADSQRHAGIRFCLNGPDSMRTLEYDGQTEIGSDHVGSQPPAQAYRAGADDTRLGRRRSGSAGRTRGRRQPADGVALAAALLEEGVDGLLRAKTRKPGKAPIAAETVARVVALTCAASTHEAAALDLLLARLVRHGTDAGH